MKFSVIVPSINSFDMLFRDCIDTFKEFNGSDCEIIIVDDGSEQTLQSRIAQECLSKGYKFLFNEQNLGFPKTVNKGMRAATGDCIILCNNDVRFIQNVLDPIKKAFELHPKVGIVGAQLLYPAGNLQHAGIISHGPAMFTHRGWHKKPDEFPDCYKTDYMIGVTGALFAIRREAMEEVGFMNEDFFLSCDDTEYCLRAWKKDWRVLYCGQVKAIHAEGATRGANDREKLTKNRKWMIEERKTMNKFFTEFDQNFNWGEIQNKVRECNLELLAGGEEVKRLQENPGSEKVYYGNGNGRKTILVPENSKKVITVRRTGAMGDVLLTTGIIRKLKQENPKNSIVVSTHCDFVFRNNPYIEKCVKNIAEVSNAEKVFDLDLCYESNPKVPVIQAYAERVFGAVDPNYDFVPDLFSSSADHQSALSKIGEFLKPQDKYAVFHMPMSWPSRTWPRDKWNQVTRIISSSGFKVIVVGRGNDFRSDLYANVLNLVDNLSIHEIKELCERANVFVGMDSGVMHVAMTTGCPVVGLFTVANPDYRIFNRTAKTMAIIPKTPCRFCLHEASPPVQFVACKFQTNHCLNDFIPQEVAESAREISR